LRQPCSRQPRIQDDKRKAIYECIYIWIKMRKPYIKESFDDQTTWNEYDTVYIVYDCIMTYT
jgi:hypothetical protein